MLSLDRMLAEHGSVLVLDGSGSAQAAWWAAPSAPVRSVRETGEAGVGLFRSIAAVCPQPNQAGAFAFCAAPGSVLGIRTAAAAIRVWNALKARPVYSFHALQLAAAAAPRKMAYVADARRGHWHFFVSGEPPRQLATADLAAACGPLPLATPEGYRHWQPLPPGTATIPYELGTLLSAAANVEVFERTDLPDAALIAQPSYVPWTPRIHQNP